MESLFRNRVKRTTRTTRTVTLFEWGGGYRVKYVKVSNSKVDSKLLSHLDEFHQTLEAAQQAFNEISLAIGS